ncbi:MAG: UDP-N-acetylmuramate dehydrogenase, partial [Bdellovibrionales bacterium]|nr:UDP-N-acetylmuramate dehydrogenase [Bdellovibrionales bacterium]
MGACESDSSDEHLIACCPVKLSCNLPASRYTTVSCSGSIRRLIEPDSPEELSAALEFLNANSITWRVLGAGSNLIIRDNLMDAWVLKLGRGFRYFTEINSSRFLVGAGMSLMNLSRRLSEKGMSGLEFAGGIPATVGGATRMNAGAHGGQMSDVLTSIRYMTPEGRLITANAQEFEWSYRATTIPQSAIIVEVELELKKDDPEVTKAKRQACLNERKARQPLHFPSFGSVFKNPSPNQAAGQLIESAGLKGYRIGKAQVSTMHANWIVNPTREASAKDILSLITYVQE